MIDQTNLLVLLIVALGLLALLATIPLRPDLKFYELLIPFLEKIFLASIGVIATKKLSERVARLRQSRRAKRSHIKPLHSHLLKRPQHVGDESEERVRGNDKP